MALGVNSLIEIVMNMSIAGAQMLNVYTYKIDAMPALVGAVDIGEAWWNHVKAEYRALASVTFGNAFQTVRVRELNNPAGEYAEYAIPPAEQIGLRAAPSVEASPLPPFNAVGVRLVVGTRSTRPGQKRIPFLLEYDNGDGALGAAFYGWVGALMTKAVSPTTLGVPAALTTLLPLVTRRNAVGDVIASQPVEGFIVNSIITSQNTRKRGRGA